MRDKEKFLEVYAAKLGYVKDACEAAGISRKTFYNWKNDDEEFAQSVQEIEEGLIDLAESKLFENIKGNKTNEILFYLKTKGKNRGYVERQEHHIEGGFPTKIEIEIIDENKNE